MTKLKIIYFGSPYYSVLLLKKIISLGHYVPLVISQGSKKTRRGKRVHTAIYEFCEKNKLRCITPDKYSDNILEDISTIKADLGIVYAYGKLIPQHVVDTTKFGIMNLHCSLLPAYRGAAPIQHALINNEVKTGITYFEINENYFLRYLHNNTPLIPVLHLSMSLGSNAHYLLNSNLYSTVDHMNIRTCT